MDFLEILDYEKFENLYNGEEFKRNFLKYSESIHVLNDQIQKEGDEINLNFISIEENIPLSMDKIPNLQKIDNGGFFGEKENDSLIWIPLSPVLRRYDANKRIYKEKNIPMSINKANKKLLNRSLNSKEKIEMLIVILKGSQYKKELTSFLPVERRVYFRNDWFKYNSLEDFWDYLIQGSIYHPLTKSKRFKCQLCAYTWFKLFNYLKKVTQKDLYGFLNAELAYSVLLDQNKDGQWEHGYWSDEMETHTRFQNAGINLLINYYQETGVKVFKERAENGIQYIFKNLTDEFDEGIWFLHDTLESSQEIDDHYWYRRFLPTKEFLGKSPSNNLILNTHLQTLNTLIRLGKSPNINRDIDIFENGIKSARKLLSFTSNETLYKAIDIFYEPINSEKKYTLKRKLLTPFLLLMKICYPRLAMPNGFIERDLSASAMSEFYHIQNLKDLLITYIEFDEDWILDFVEKGIEFSLKKENYKRILEKGRESTIFLDVLILYSFVNGSMVKKLPEVALYIIKKYSGVPLDSIVLPLNLVDCPKLEIDNRKLYILYLPLGKNNEKVVLINPTKEKQRGKLKISKKKIPIEVDSENFLVVDL